jgi:putative hydrolase
MPPVPQSSPLPSPLPSSPPADVNGIAAALLRDLSLVQTSPHSMWGYKRAASAVFQLDEPITALLQADGTLRKIPHIGPSSARVMLEVIHTGGSPTVERTVDASPKRAEVERRRALRNGFLSRAQVVAILAGADPDAGAHANANANATADMRFAALAAQSAQRSTRVASMADYRGDLQMHSVWSDGSQTLAQIVDEARRREYAFAAVTDHSYGLRIANGLSMEDIARQHEEIDRLNAQLAGVTSFRLLKGIEANIRADGTLDMSAAELARLDIVVAAPHAALRSPLPQTSRMIAAVTTPGVHILGHPRGRMYGSRPGVTADWPAVFAAAAQAGVAIEIDGDPARQDIDYQLAAQARDAGCLFALDSDAHGPRDWRYVETALAHARLAGVPAERIINTWPLDKLLAWAETRRPRH